MWLREHPTLVMGFALVASGSMFLVWVVFVKVMSGDDTPRLIVRSTAWIVMNAPIHIIDKIRH